MLWCTDMRPRIRCHHNWRIFKCQQMLLCAQRPGDSISSHTETGQGHRGQRALLLWPWCYFWKLPSVHRCLLEKGKKESEGEEVLKYCDLPPMNGLRLDNNIYIDRKNQHNKMGWNRLWVLGPKSKAKFRYRKRRKLHFGTSKLQSVLILPGVHVHVFMYYLKLLNWTKRGA